MNEKYGYLRVSSRDQNEARQLAALQEYGIPSKNLYTDRQSGKDFERPQYRRLLKKLKAGDLLVVKSIDRLGRNYGEILEQWRLITKSKGVDIIIVDMPLLDTRTQGRDLTGTFIADLVLQILSYVAEAERTNIKQRQAEGIAAALARGVKFGREAIPLPPAFTTVRERYLAGEMNSIRAGVLLGVSGSTFLRWLRKY